MCGLSSTAAVASLVVIWCDEGSCLIVATTGSIDIYFFNISVPVEVVDSSDDDVVVKKFL